MISHNLGGFGSKLTVLFVHALTRAELGRIAQPERACHVQKRDAVYEVVVSSHLCRRVIHQ